MNITALSLKRPVSVAMFFVCMTLIGLIAGQRLPLESLPDIEFPFMVVNVPYRNSTPEEVERRITRPVEEAIATLPGLKKIESKSKDDGAEFELQFDWGTDLAVKGVEARDKIDAIRDRLPDDVQRIQVFKFSGSDQPMLQLRISADRDLSGAYDMLDRNLKRRIERIAGVSKVELYGVEEKQVRISLAADRIASHGVDIAKLGEQLQKANFAMSAGQLTDGKLRYTVRPEGEFTSLESVGDTVIDESGLRLRDVADVQYTDPELTYGRHLNRKFAIGINVFKEQGSNLVEVGDRVKAEIEQVKMLPEMSGIRLFLMQDSASEVKDSLGDLLEAGAIGAVLSVIVLWFFLRDIRMTLIVTLSVPLSLCMTLAAMYFLGLTLNILTLMGLMLAVGMLVDNAVVVTESIFTERTRMGNSVEATLAGVRKVGMAVVAGTLTTAIVFLPNIFGAQNDITVFMSQVAYTITIALTASLLVAVTLIPQLTTRMVSGDAASGARFLIKLSAFYERTLGWTLRHRGWTTLLIIVLLGSVAIPAGVVKTDFFPNEDGKRIVMEYNLNGIYRVSKVEEAVNTIEHYLYANEKSLGFESVYSYFDMGQAQTVLIMPEKELRTRTNAQVMDEIRDNMPKIAIGQIGFDHNRSGSADKLGVRVFGESAEHLRDVAQNVVDVLRLVKGLNDVHIVAEAEDQEVRIRIDRDRARQNGLSSQQVADAVAAAMRGTELRPYRTNTGEVDMVLEFRRQDRADFDAILSMPIVRGDGQRITLGSIAQVDVGPTPGTITRENRMASLKVQFGTSEGVTSDDAKKSVEAVLNDMQFPAGYSWGYSQAFDDEADSMQTMLINMLLAMVLIYLVMAALFESTLEPSAIITGIFFSFVGVFWFFMITVTTFSFMAMIGLLILMGVVVNNGIVLIDHVHQLREAGMPREQAVVQGSRDRLRPILMTVATAALGMVPLAVGDTAIGGNGPPYYPMARAIIGGLVFSTIVSLGVLPSIYCMLDDLRIWGGRVVARARGRHLSPRGVQLH
jgi:HAE1 family hydrophobic/amphiphilic exporter-1